MISVSTHTPLARRDLRRRASFSHSVRVSTHTPLARRDFAFLAFWRTHYVSTHTPLARRDYGRTPMSVIITKFQLTRLLRGVTMESLKKYKVNAVSTHTPLARRDEILPK